MHKEIVSFFRLFASLEVLVSNHNVENGFQFHIRRTEGRVKCGVLHGTKNEIPVKEKQ
jgi:hypothetical protein